MVKSPRVGLRTHFSFSFTHPKSHALRVKSDFKPFSRDHLIDLFGLDEELDAASFKCALAEKIRDYKMVRNKDEKGIMRKNKSEGILLPTLSLPTTLLPTTLLTTIFSPHIFFKVKSGDFWEVEAQKH